jgi:hypothetical protein
MIRVRQGPLAGRRAADGDALRVPAQPDRPLRLPGWPRNLKQATVTESEL